MIIKRTTLCFFTLLLGVAISSYARTPDQPNMQKALSNLQGAKAELKAALANKGGHRAKAIEFVNAAIAEVNAGIRFDRRHNHATILFGEAAADQPHMEAALTNLQNARNNLDDATADKGGHRAKAIALVDKAIDEVKKGIAAGA